MPWRALLLVLLPFLVFGASNFLSAHFGAPAGYFPQPSIPNGDAESAGRIKTITAFMLFAALGVGVLIYAAAMLRLLDGRSRRRTLIVYLLIVAAGTAVVCRARAFEGTPYLDQAFACSSFNLLERPSPVPPADNKALTERAAWRHLTPADLDRVRHCAAPQFGTLHLFITILGVLLLFGMPAVIFGAIVCLATPSAASPSERLKAWTLQARRLNHFLYLAAAYMVSGLLFTSAQLGWVTYSIHPADAGPLREHISSIVLHGGISNSIVIASYYLPVAIWLAATRPAEPKAKGTPQADVKGGAELGHPDPFAPVKVGLTILAPALVGFAGDLFGLGL